MKRIKSISCFLVLLWMCCCCSGCQSLLIAEETVLTLGSQMPPTANINSLTTEQPGTVCDISDNYEYLLSVNNNNSLYTIDQYQIATNSLVNLTSSETRIYEVKSTEKGFFYSKVNPSNPVNIQVMWSTMDKTVERTITDNYDNASETICAYGKDNVIYVNDRSSLVFSNSEGIKKKYDLEQNLEVSKILWVDSSNTGFLIGRSPGDYSFTLYHFSIDENKLNQEAIAINVLDMDLSRNEKQLVYTTQENNNVRVMIIPDVKTSNYTQKGFLEENIEKIHFNHDDKTIYFTKTSGVGTRSTLWSYNIETGETCQLTSPLRICSDIIPLDNNNEVFFSASQQSYIENSDIIMSYNYINKLVYTLPRKN